MSEEQSQEQNSMYNPEVNYFGLTNYRNQFRKFGIKLDDRRRHMYVIGKTGMGKTTILENMVLNDIYAGHGIGLVDPHGDFAEKVLNYVPPHRINDIVYFNPSDLEFPVGFNILESVNEEYRHLVASGLMGVFKKIWPDVWSARMEYILNNTILALIGYPDTTLLGINRLLSDEDYREKVIAAVKDPVVKAFWDVEFASYSDKYKQEAVAPIQNKIGQFLSASIIRNIVAQVKSTINIREIMDSRKIFIMNLSKGRIGEDSSRLLGGMLITKIQLSAMERVDTPEKERKDFFLYVDEFQNFATESFSNILSEARKYRLDLIMAHQYMEQLDEGVRAAVIGNVGTMAMFRVGSTDADILAKEFAPTFTEEDLVNLPKFHIYLKLMIDGVASRPFSALTLPPIAAATGSFEKVIRVSRERYGTPRQVIEEKIAKWSGVFEDKPPASNGGIGSSGNGGGGGSKNGGSGKPSSGNKSGGGGGGKFQGKSNGPSKNFANNSKGKPFPPKSSPPPKITPVSATPTAPVKPVELVDSSQPGVSLSQIAPLPTHPAPKPIAPPVPPLQSESFHQETVAAPTDAVAHQVPPPPAPSPLNLELPEQSPKPSSPPQNKPEQNTQEQQPHESLNTQQNKSSNNNQQSRRESGGHESNKQQPSKHTNQSRPNPSSGQQNKNNNNNSNNNKPQSKPQQSREQSRNQNQSNSPRNSSGQSQNQKKESRSSESRQNTATPKSASLQELAKPSVSPSQSPSKPNDQGQREERKLNPPPPPTPQPQPSQHIQPSPPSVSSEPKTLKPGEVMRLDDKT